MRLIKNHIPNAITSMNLLCGCLSIIFAAKGQIDWAGYAIFFAAVFDFFDGFAARLLKANSAIGLQLDSLADMVSFGVAPSMMLFYSTAPVGGGAWGELLRYSPFLIAVFSALRLAKFNIDERQTDSFIGMPTPACSILIASYLIYNTHVSGSAVNTYISLAASIILSALLVSEIPMFSLKIKKQRDISSFISKYWSQLLLIITSLVLIACLYFLGITLTIIFYLIMSIGLSLVKK